uniref:Histidinol-phosphate aminotransferase n=1 Tax=bacterium enrichment culture clone fosmid MGS-K1 TaxID=1549356 RepID=A0A0B5KQU1_9BACT|nr:histidinol-phosphate aminotransferase [bacterium enrichment culture clone fosmid MGS-K1]
MKRRRSKDKEEIMESLVRDDIMSMESYAAVEPVHVLAERVGVPLERTAKLDSNENPYGCSPRVRQALGNFEFYHTYPDHAHREMREMLEEYTGIGTEYIGVANGSDEMIDLILRVVLDPGDKVLNFPPTFGTYSVHTEANRGGLLNVPRDPDTFDVDIAAAKSAIDDRTRAILLSNPNNPTGNLTPERDILELLETGLLVIVDEAYYEFSELTVAHLVPSYPNLIVLRSMSKWAALAGLRVGYAILPPTINDCVYKSKPIYNVNMAAEIAAKESLKDAQYMKQTVRTIISERERLYRLLDEQGILKPLPSQGNFLLCQAPDGNGARIKEHFQNRGIFVRHFPALYDMLRITVGKPEHTDAMIKALDELEV